MLARGLDIKFCPPEETYNGFYSSRAKQVVLCCDKFSGKEALRSTLTHELVHVYDVIFFPVILTSSFVGTDKCGTAKQERAQK
jgi:hypothetical protein